jgi:hypothetical protein
MPSIHPPFEITLSNYLSKKMWAIKKKKRERKERRMLKSMSWTSASPRKK